MRAGPVRRAAYARGGPTTLFVEPGDSGVIKSKVRVLIDARIRRSKAVAGVIIDEADALLPGAQNALLKTLEEPPSLSVFLLITARPDALLPTVRSRCPVLRFRPLGPDDVTAALVQRGRTPADARLVAATADGSVGRALEASAADLERREMSPARSSAAASTGPRAASRGSEGPLERRGRSGRVREHWHRAARDGIVIVP